MAFYVYINTTDNRRVRLGYFTTREAAETAAAVAMHGNLSNIVSVEISSDVLPNA